MNKQKFDINNLRVASPCHVGWENMSGDERSRHCNSCKMNVYNIAGMTKIEAKNLITNREGRICIRLYKRADGTVLTKDCPVGLRVFQKRVARLAGATFAAILGLFSVSFGQIESQKLPDDSKVNIIRTQSNQNESELSGVIRDSSGAIIPKAKITLTKKDGKKLKTFSDKKGFFRFSKLSDGNYILETTSEGFNATKLEDLKIKSQEKIQLEISLEVSPIYEVVGIFIEESPVISSGGTTIITQEMIERFPL